MKIKLKKIVAICGSALVAIASSWVCMGGSRRFTYAEGTCNQTREKSSYNITKNIYDSTVFSWRSFKEPCETANGISVFSSSHVESLLGSTVYGDWNASFSKYNCYAYVLGRTSKYDIIGEFSNNIVEKNIYGELNYSIQELAYRTVQDLKCLGNECVTSEKNWFYEPYEGQTLICVRKSLEDFHFMKYVDGVWLHKPGNTWILKYNGTPSADVDWYAECAYIYNCSIYCERDDSIPYTGDIYFIKYANSHNYSTYKYYNANQHEIKCKNCSMLMQVENHIYKPYSKDAKICTKCGYVLCNSGIGISPMKEVNDKI